jgi:hypothetical protein
MQKINKAGCALFLVAAPALSVAINRYLPPATGEERAWFAVASGVLLASGLSSLWQLLSGSLETREKLLRRSESGPVADGQTMLVSGHVRATSSPLTAPLSGTPCVAYFYRFYRRVRGLRHEPDEELPVYWGYASRPFVVDTPRGAVAVTGAPRLSLPRTPHGGEEAVARARDYLRGVRSEVRSPRLPFAGDPVRQWMSEVAADADGSTRHDWQSGDVADLVALRLEEVALPVGAEATVYGRWSAQRDAVAAGGRNDPVALTVALSRASLGTAAGVPASLLGYWIGTLAATGVGAGLIWFASRVWPHLK